MKTLYLDIFSGISGDMFVGAMLDLGVDFGQLERELAKLGLGGYHLHVSRRQKAGIEGTKFDVHLEHDHHAREGSHEHAHGGEGHGHAHGSDSGHHEHTHSHEHTHEDGTTHSHPHTHAHSHSHGEHEHSHGDHDHGRNFSDIRRMIEGSALSGWVKQKSVAVFGRVAEAEGKVHGLPPAEVHFHEVGAVDSIIDIVGACIALEMLGRPRVVSAPVVEGTGWVNCAHGRFPVPTPATLEILSARGIAVTQCEEPHELVTPTGAALLAEFAEEFGPMHGLRVEKIGYAPGTRDNKTRPNVLRACLGVAGDAAVAAGLDWETDSIAVLETNLDDISAEILGHFVEKALGAGALDVFHTPVQMKKNRPGVLLTVLCAEADADKFSEMLLRETSAFGVRRSVADRRKLRREFTKIRTEFGEVTVKLGRLNGKVVQAAPEYESCRSAADASGATLRQVYDAAAKRVGAEVK